MEYQKDALNSFPDQITYAVSYFQPADLNAEDFDNIILCGLGGSGIAGHFTKSILFDKSPVPVEVISGYSLPNYVGKRTLAIISSYSGDTEETIAMYKDAKEKGARIICIATGGKLIELCRADENTYYLSKTGLHPRMALGYSLTFQLMILSKLYDLSFAEELPLLVSHLQNSEAFITNATKIYHNFRKSPDRKWVIITDRITYPIGLRLSQQLQENAKKEAFVHILPEMNHNVIESYTGKMKSNFLLLNSKNNERMDTRFSFVENHLKEHKNKVVTLEMKNISLKAILSVTYRLDWLSLILAHECKINSSEIPNITKLKEHLSEVLK